MVSRLWTTQEMASWQEMYSLPARLEHTSSDVTRTPIKKSGMMNIVDTIHHQAPNASVRTKMGSSASPHVHRTWGIMRSWWPQDLEHSKRFVPSQISHWAAECTRPEKDSTRSEQHSWSTRQRVNVRTSSGRHVMPYAANFTDLSSTTWISWCLDSGIWIGQHNNRIHSIAWSQKQYFLPIRPSKTHTHQSCPRVTFLGPDPTRPGEMLTRPDPRLPTKSLTRPDPTRGPTLPPYVHSLIE